MFNKKFYVDKFNNIFYKVDIDENHERCDLGICPFAGDKNTVRPCRIMYKDPIDSHYYPFENYCNSLNVGKGKYYIPIQISENYKTSIFNDSSEMIYEYLIGGHSHEENYNVKIVFKLGDISYFYNNSKCDLCKYYGRCNTVIVDGKKIYLENICGIVGRRYNIQHKYLAVPTEILIEEQVGII